jgi:hypothetical protein
VGIITGLIGYYPEADIEIIGRYARDINVEQAMEYKRVGFEKYGRRLKEVQIEYTKRKEGVKVRYITMSQERADRCIYLKSRLGCDRTRITYLGMGPDVPAIHLDIPSNQEIAWEGEK